MKNFKILILAALLVSSLNTVAQNSEKKIRNGWRHSKALVKKERKHNGVKPKRLAPKKSSLKHF